MCARTVTGKALADSDPISPAFVDLKATGLERALQPIPLGSVSIQRIFVCQTSTVNGARHADAARTLLHGKSASV